MNVNELGPGDADPEVHLTSSFVQMHSGHFSERTLYDKFLLPALGILVIGRAVCADALGSPPDPGL